MFRSQAWLLPTVSALALAASASPAYAYFDPASGGMLFQLLAPLGAIIVGFGIFLRERLLSAIRTLFSWGKPK